MDAVQKFFGAVYSWLASVEFGRLVTITLCVYGALMLVYVLACAFSRSLRAAGKRPVFHFVNAFTALFFAELLIGMEVQAALFFAVLFWLAGYLYYGAVCALTRKKPAPQPRTSGVVSALPEHSRPRPSAQGVPAANGSVRLDHALSIADKLLLKQLSRADRQELEKIKTNLTVLQVKGDPSPQEGEVINAQFASLLKLMSKYGY